jgi:hypothetical protein
MSEDARFGAPAGHAAGERADDYGFFAPLATAAPGTAGVDSAVTAAPFTPGQLSAAPPFGTPSPFGAPASPVAVDAPVESGLPVWAVVLLAIAVLSVLGIVAAVVRPALLNDGHDSKLANTRVLLPGSVVGLARSTNPAAQAQADRLAATMPRGFGPVQAAGYAGSDTLLLVAAAKAPHVLTIAEQQVITQSYWATAASSVPDGSSLDAPSPPSGFGFNGMLTCAPEVTPDGGGALCIDVAPTAMVVYMFNGSQGADQAQETAVPAAVVHVP